MFLNIINLYEFFHLINFDSLKKRKNLIELENMHLLAWIISFNRIILILKGFQINNELFMAINVMYRLL